MRDRAGILVKEIRKTICTEFPKRREEKMVCCQENNEEVTTNVRLCY